MLKFVLILSLIIKSSVNCCQKPEIQSNSYTTQDATLLTQIAYISEFTVNCQSGINNNVKNLYALMDSINIVPIGVNSNTNKYQISWTEDIKTAKIGDVAIKIFDEDGYTLLRKALRTGDDLQQVKPFAIVNINHPGIYKGPWISCECLAVVCALIISYYAITFRSKLLA